MLYQGTRGNDSFCGKFPDDTMYGANGDDVLLGRKGDDTLYGGCGEDTLFGGEGDDSLYGGWTNDTLGGGVGNDLLRGDAGWDTIFGGDGSDKIAPGTGVADVWGDGDKDMFYVVDNSTVRLHDFQSGYDKIDIRPTPLSITLSPDGHFAYIDTGGFNIKLHFVDDASAVALSDFV